MENIVMPIIPSIKEDKITNQILKSLPEESVGNIIDLNGNGSSDDLKLVLLGMGMEKYNDLFIKNNININTFLQLDERDLKEIGITDTKDLETVAMNILNFGPRQKLTVRNNSLDDLQIARNVKNELILLQNYCSYLELQMRKQKLTDYRINWKESATVYLKAFAETALLQARFLKRKVYHDFGNDHLLGKTLKVNNLTLPDHLKEKLIKNKPKGRQKVLCVVAFIGILSAAVILKYLS